MPALLTRTCSAPCSLTIASISASTAAPSVTSSDDAAAARERGQRLADRRGAGLGGRGADDATALARQFDGDRPADAARGAGDQGDLRRGRRRVAHLQQRLGRRSATPGRCTATDSRVGVDALDHAGQHLAGAAFDDVGDAAGADRLHRLDPAHRAEGLAVAARRGSRRARSRCDVDVVDHRDPRRGDRDASPAARCRRSAAGFISGEWNGAETGSGSARLAPAALSSSQALSTPALRAGDHGLLRIVEVGRLDDLAGRSRAAAQPSRTAAASSPRIAAIAPVPTGTASCIACGAKAHQRQRVGERQIAPAATSAVYSPSEWPATTAGASRVSRQPGAIAGDAGGQHHRLGVGRSGRAAPSGPRGSAGRRLRRAPSEASSSVCRTAALSPQASSMPTDCEPWPGKTNANGVMTNDVSAVPSSGQRLRSRAAPRPR